MVSASYMDPFLIVAILTLLFVVCIGAMIAIVAKAIPNDDKRK